MSDDEKNRFSACEIRDYTDGLGNEDVQRVVDRIVKVVVKLYTRKREVLDDYKQILYLKVIELLRNGEYTEDKPLDSFLFACCKNHLLTYMNKECGGNTDTGRAVASMSQGSNSQSVGNHKYANEAQDVILVRSHNDERDAIFQDAYDYVENYDPANPESKNLYELIRDFRVCKDSEDTQGRKLTSDQVIRVLAEITSYYYQRCHPQRPSEEIPPHPSANIPSHSSEDAPSQFASAEELNNYRLQQIGKAQKERNPEYDVFLKTHCPQEGDPLYGDFLRALVKVQPLTYTPLDKIGRGENKFLGRKNQDQLRDTVKRLQETIAKFILADTQEHVPSDQPPLHDSHRLVETVERWMLGK